jgi:hypothetical protein
LELCPSAWKYLLVIVEPKKRFFFLVMSLTQEQEETAAAEVVVNELVPYFIQQLFADDEQTQNAGQNQTRDANQQPSVNALYDEAKKRFIQEEENGATLGSSLIFADLMKQVSQSQSQNGGSRILDYILANYKWKNEIQQTQFRASMSDLVAFEHKFNLSSVYIEFKQLCKSLKLNPTFKHKLISTIYDTRQYLQYLHL